MKLYYTTVGQQDLVQQRKEYSLGGFKSASPVQNSLGNLFSQLSTLSEERLLSEYIGLMLWNDSGSDVENITLWFEYPVDDLLAETNLCKFEISATVLDSNNKMEHIENLNNKPFSAEFYEANGKDNEVGLGALLNGEGIGLWVKRSIIKERIALKKDNDTLNANYDSNLEPIYVEDVKLKIDWVASTYGGEIGGGNL